MNNNCNETNWEACFLCNLFSFCDKKEFNRQGILTVFNHDIKILFQKIKKKLIKK